MRVANLLLVYMWASALLSLIAAIRGYILILLTSIEDWVSMLIFSVLSRNRARKLLKTAFNWLDALWKECSCALEKQSFPFSPSHYRPKRLGRGDFSSSLLCISMHRVMLVASLLMIAGVDDCGGNATWSLQVSVQPAHALNVLGIPSVSPGLLGWYAVGIMRHRSFELGILMAAAKLQEPALQLKSQSRSVPGYA